MYWRVCVFQISVLQICLGVSVQYFLGFLIASWNAPVPLSLASFLLFSPTE